MDRICVKVFVRPIVCLVVNLHHYFNISNDCIIPYLVQHPIWDYEHYEKK